MQVTLREGESFESLLRRFRAAIARGNIIGEYKRHQTFMSRSEKLRARLKKAQRRRMMKMARRAA